MPRDPKLRRIERYGTEAYAAEIRRHAEWNAAHREQLRECKRRWEIANRVEWPIGLTVYVEAGGFWHEGQIVGRTTNQRCSVLLRIGGVVERTVWQLRRDPPFPVVDF